MIFWIFALFLLFLPFFRNRPEINKILKTGLWILREIWKMAIGFYNWWKFIGKFMVWILVKFGFIGLDIYYFLRNLPKIMKNGWKTLKSKRETKNRNFYKNRSRRSKNRNFKTKPDYLKSTGIPKYDEEKVEKGRSGKKGKKLFLFRENYKKKKLQK